jgi:outer membrane protein TolC
MIRAQHIQESTMSILETTRTVHAAGMVLLGTTLLTMFAQFSAAQTTERRAITLNEAIDLALKQNRNLQLARLAVAETEQKKVHARSDYFPKLKNESTILHVTDLERLEIPAGALANPATGPVPTQNVYLGQGTLTAYTSGTSIAQPITQTFKIRQANRAAATDIRIAESQAAGTEEMIALKVRQVYFGILIDKLKVEAAAEQLSANEVKSRESVADIERGNALDVAQIESQAAVLEAQQELLTVEFDAHDLQLTLSDLLGLSLKTELILSDRDLSLSTTIPSREECIALAKANNTELQAAAESVRKAQAGLSAAKDAYIPDITGFARYTYQSGVPLLPHNFGTFGVTMNWDLFDGGRRNANIHDADIVLNQARIHATQVAEEVEIEIETAYDKVQRTQSLVSVAQQAVALRSEAVRISDTRFEQNAALPSERSQAHALLAAAKASLLEANLGLTLAQGDLLRSTGQIPR